MTFENLYSKMADRAEAKAEAARKWSGYPKGVVRLWDLTTWKTQWYLSKKWKCPHDTVCSYLWRLKQKDMIERRKAKRSNRYGPMFEYRLKG